LDSELLNESVTIENRTWKKDTRYNIKSIIWTVYS